METDRVNRVTCTSDSAVRRQAEKGVVATTHAQISNRTGAATVAVHLCKANGVAIVVRTLDEAVGGASSQDVAATVGSDEVGGGVGSLSVTVGVSETYSDVVVARPGDLAIG